WYDAAAYCRWRSLRDGVFYRLPRDVEYEKAARGADERLFPWGDHFDPAFCKMTQSRPGFSQIEPAGAFPIDESPYGIRDLAGGMRCWLADIEGEYPAEALAGEPEPARGSPRDQSGIRAVRGGSWTNAPSFSRSASRYRFFGLVRYVVT